MVTITRVLTVSALTAWAASASFFIGRHALGDASANGAPNAQQGGASANNHRAAAVVPQTRVPSVRIKTHVLLLSRALLDEVQIDYNLLIPTHHVRPDTDETLSAAALIDESTAGRLLEIAHSGPENLDFSPSPDDYPEYEDEFDCLSDMFRGGEPLPPELTSSVINGLSLAYALSASSDHRNVVFAPVTLMRADYPAAEIPNTAAHEAKYAHHVNISVPNGGTLLIDAGPVKATRSESNPSRHLVVLVQPQLIKIEQQNLSECTPTPVAAPAASLVSAALAH